MTLKKGFKQLVAAAAGRVCTHDAKAARDLLSDGQVVFVDVRDVRELDREGMIPGAIHVPRGMLEFWFDPESPYHKHVLTSGKPLVLYCQSGWRSALATATLLDMGFENVSHVGGGFSSWKLTGGPITSRQKNKTDHQD